MSKKVRKPAPTIASAPAKPATATPPFRIKYPLLWLVAIIFILYAGTIHYDFTDLDDGIFIKDMQAYNAQLSHLFTSFHRGVFNAVNDEYYRPMLLNSMILNYAFSGIEIQGYHLFNILLHIAGTGLLYMVFRALSVSSFHSFLLCLLFAVHPALSQAVIWIPGRNDSLLGLFVFGYLWATIRYTQTGNWKFLIGVFLLLAASFFTKESAIAAPLSALLIQVFILKEKLFSRRQLIQYGIWMLSGGLYFALRATASIKGGVLHVADIITGLPGRIPIMLQYLGKIIFPFNLSVFPIQEDTVYYWGFAALLTIAVLIFLTKEKKWNWYLAGIGIFLAFLLPLLILPKNLNEQTFEHRLYLPIVGILLLLSQTILFDKSSSDKKSGIIVAIVAAVFAFINLQHQPHFKDALSFWEQGHKTSPHSAYATMMYGARVEDKQEGFRLMRKAYQLNPDEKYLNYYYGVMLQHQDSLLASEAHFLREKKKSGYYECDFYLAKVAFYKKDFQQAAVYLEDYVKADKTNEAANNNLLLLYMTALKDKSKAQAQINRMSENGITVSNKVRQEVANMPHE